MTTELLYRTDAYLQATPARVLFHTPEGGIVTDRTVFYATGGGQPGDSGRVEWDGGRLTIATALKVEGGGIALVRTDGRLQFDVNMTNLTKANLKPSSQMMRLVRQVIGSVR